MNSEMQTSKDGLLSETSCPNMLFPEQANEEVELTIRDPVNSQTKGRQKDDAKLPKSGRIKSSLELSMNDSQEKDAIVKYVKNLVIYNRRSCAQAENKRGRS
ncbi:unnamed protein product [Trifolium pratense]|uniref:Uncharacterized protein n=1 Tax=Trifolium pratense TaxID=57577 RepID=A0ACB0JG15_TRIPR|nr:unnamed protein product [Trifolium pratense]